MKMLAVRMVAFGWRSLSPIPMTAALAAAIALSGSASAQTTLSHTEDAAPIPAGMLRLRASPSWTRYDERFATTGRTSADRLSADPLGAQQLPNLRPLDDAVRELAGDQQMHLSLGKLVTHSDARIVVTPISLEYGVTRRLMVGVMLPLVQTRHVIGIDVNSKTGAPANVGYLLAKDRGAAYNANKAAIASLKRASDDLTALINRCRTTPSASSCEAYNADAAGATTAQQQADAFAKAVLAFGMDSASTLLAPRGGGSLALEIELRRNALNQRLQQFLGTGAAAVSQLYFAGDDFAYLDLQGSSGAPGLLKSPLGGGLDSLHTTERIHIGDVAVGAQFLVFDRFQRDTLPRRFLQSRLMVGGSVRFATSMPDSGQQLLDISTGNGAGFELNSALDLVLGRLGSTFAARLIKYRPRAVTAALANPDTPGWPIDPTFALRQRTAGDVVAFDVTPRYFVADWMALEGHYGFERTGAPTYADAGNPCSTCDLADSRTAQRLGLGLRYSTVDSYARGQARYPVEVSFTHLETTSGDAGVPKLSRDQIQMRLFFRILGR